ncbi:hypothetical protein M0802_008042 [Mischocyttarus mexicanus]|nr:hypothetical protein M0802_008042 [Mischocyttarus mexicanus]
MSEFCTPVKASHRPKIDTNLCTNPLEIPASPLLQQIGHGTGVHILKFERSPSVGFVKSPWAIKKRNSKLPVSEALKERLEFEGNLLKKLNHPNIVGFRGFGLSYKGELCLAMEQMYKSLGDIIEIKIDNGEDIFPAKDILHVGHEMAKGLDYLHNTMHILHGDMKSYNVLVSIDLLKVKLCDFGVSVPLTDTLEMKDTNGEFYYVGTECWSAPEALGTGPITNKCDIWSYGLILWEMIALSPPHICNTDKSRNTDDDQDDDDEDVMSLKVSNDTSNESSDEDFDEDFKMKRSLGTRPPLPAINLSEEYENVLDVFHICTIHDYRLRPSAKGLINYFAIIFKKIGNN